MKKKITGAITFFAGIFAVIFAIYLRIDIGNLISEMNFLVLYMLIGGVSASLYVYWTHFDGDQENSKVERENKLLKSKIEQKKLRKELEED